MFSVGDTFQSPSALTQCLSTAHFDETTQKVVIDTKSLRPQTVNSKNVGSSEQVWHNNEMIGRFDLRNIDENRANSLWEITEVTTDGAGCGSSHNISGKHTHWPRYYVTAKRVNIDGSDHASKETISFSNAGLFTVKDYRAVRLPLPD